MSFTNFPLAQTCASCKIFGISFSFGYEYLFKFGSYLCHHHCFVGFPSIFICFTTVLSLSENCMSTGKQLSRLLSLSFLLRQKRKCIKIRRCSEKLRLRLRLRIRIFYKCEYNSAIAKCSPPVLANWVHSWCMWVGIICWEFVVFMAFLLHAVLLVRLLHLEMEKSCSQHQQHLCVLWAKALN